MISTEGIGNGEKNKRKVTLITGVILVMLAKLLQDELGSLMKTKFCNVVVYLSEW